ncbi:MAG: hypothetical protein E7666_00500 [Ruminococcaceae bacterium]|nr:hypothetical protein [Oscillospiraceae bacterium]
MKKLTVLLLLLSMLLCMFASCFQNGTPPTETFDSNDASESDTESETEPDELEIISVEWAPELKAFWDSLVAKDMPNPTCITAQSFQMDYPILPMPVEEYTETKEIEKKLNRIIKCNDYLSNPVFFDTSALSVREIRNYYWVIEGYGEFLFGLYEFKTESGEALYTVCLQLMLYEKRPNVIGDIGCAQLFLLTEEQFRPLSASLLLETESRAIFDY